MPDRRSEKARKIEDLVPADPGTLGGYALNYLHDLEIRNYSRHTVRNLRSNLRVFLCWCHERGLLYPGEIAPEIFKRYQRWLYHHRKTDGKRLSFGAQRQRLSSVKRLYRWLLKRRVIDWDPAATIELPRAEQRLPKAVLTMREAERVLAQPDLATPLGVRDRAILETLYSTGIRRQEAVDLNVNSLDIEGGVLTVRQGKGKKDRMIPIGKRALAWIERYLDEVRPGLVMAPDSGALFLSTQCARFSPGRMSLLVRQYVAGANVGKAGSCHLFRHTMATLMLEGGADIRFIQAMLGHASLDATQVYTRVAIRKLKEIHERSHPGANPRKRPEQAASDDQNRDEKELLSVLGAPLQNSAEARIRQVRQIWTTTCWGISGIFPYMLWFEDGVHDGFWAGDDFVEGLLAAEAEEDGETETG